MKKHLVLIINIIIACLMLSSCSLIMPESSATSTSEGSTEPSTSEPEVLYPYIPIGELPDRSDENRELVEYTGAVEHIFYHPLIAYPERAFDGDFQAQGMDDYFCTVKEFKLIMEELYRRDYMLVDYSDFYSAETDKSGRLSAKKLTPKIPEGKKPLVISIDDVNYYDYMIKDGCVSKLVLGENGRVLTQSKNLDGEDVICCDNDAIPLIDSFVEAYPDFSYNGAKGLIALTGYQGILGYRVNRQSKNKQSEIEAVTPIVEALKESGWAFASHSYGHPAFENRSAEKILDDSDKWENEVQNIIGDTTVFVYPYGSAIRYGDSRLEILRDHGFTIICGVGPTLEEDFDNGLLQTLRVHIDGIGLRSQRKILSRFFDTKNVIDLESRNR